MKKETKRPKGAYMRIEREGLDKPIWTLVGTVTSNRDGSLSVLLDVLSPDGPIRIMDEPCGEQGEAVAQSPQAEAGFAIQASPALRPSWTSRAARHRRAPTAHWAVGSHPNTDARGAASPTPGPKDWAVYNVMERPDILHRSIWGRIGSAFVNGDGSLDVVLEAIPIDGWLLVRAVEGPETSETEEAVSYAGREARRPWVSTGSGSWN